MPKGMDGRLLWPRALPLLACLLVALAAGCGDSGKTDSGTGTVARRVVRVEQVKQDRWTYARARFNEMCAGCHTLADAGARGTRINLDHALGGVDELHVRYAIAHGEPGMPAWEEVLSQREYEELVRYVSTVARRQPVEDGWWHRQVTLRSEGDPWTRRDTDRLEAFARRLVRERRPRGE